MTTYNIEEKSTWEHGEGAVRTVVGTEMTISGGLVEIWNSREGSTRQLVFSLAAELVVSLSSQSSSDPERTDGRYRQCSNCGHLQPVAETPVLTSV